MNLEFRFRTVVLNQDLNLIVKSDEDEDLKEFPRDL